MSNDILSLHIISTDEDPGLRIECFAVINLRGVSSNQSIICFIAMQTYKELSYDNVQYYSKVKFGTYLPILPIIPFDGGVRTVSRIGPAGVLGV